MTSYDTHGSDGDVEGGGPSPTVIADDVDDRTIHAVADFLGNGSTTAAQDTNRAQLRAALQHMEQTRDHDGLEAEPASTEQVHQER